MVRLGLRGVGMIVSAIHRWGAAAATAALLAACAMLPGGVPAATSGGQEPGGEYLVFIDAGKPSVQLQFASAADCRRWALNMAEAGQGAPGTRAPSCMGQNFAATLPVGVALRRSSDGQLFQAQAASIPACDAFVSGMVMQGYATAVGPCQ
jgi:hypothetical protein